MGTYGVNCSQTCQCQNEATCSAVDGSCNCTAGFTGETCNEREFKDLYTYTHTHARMHAPTHTHTHTHMHTHTHTHHTTHTQREVIK